MNVQILENAQAIGAAVGQLFVEQVKTQPDSVLGLATGSSPIPTYQYMAQEYAAGHVSFRNVTTFNLDEYCDLPQKDPNSYYSFMFDNLFRHTDIDSARVNFLDGNAADDKAECAQYEKRIKDAGGIDLQLLGIGNNGHIAFNEANEDHLVAVAHTEKLTQSTIDANARFFEKKEDVPTMAITMGMGDIMAAKQVVLVATGLAKVPAIKGLVMDNNITTKNPSTMLKMHENAVVVIDKELADAVGYKA